MLRPNEDSAKVYRMHDVIVTGTRTAVPIEQLSTSVKVLDSLALEQFNGVSLADKLRNSSGLTLRGYGGNGSLQSVSFRGLGSDYSLVLIDGRRFTSHQISTVDIGIFSMNEIERIEIASGGSSSQYGSDAIGGVINIVTQQPDGKPYVSVSQSIGSFGLYGYQVSAGAGDEFFSYRAGIALRRASNMFEFTFDDGVTKRTVQRSGADYVLKNYSLSTRSDRSGEISAQLVLRYSVADRGQPSAVTNSQQNNRARINDQDLYLNSIVDFRLDEGSVLSMPVTYHHTIQTFTDPNLILNTRTVDAHYENNVFAVSPLFRTSFSPEHHAAAGAEFAAASITSNELFPSRRVQASIFLSSEHRFSVFTDIILFPSVRFDSFSDTDGDLSPKLGINIGLLDAPSVRFRSSFGRNYRVPTFNDLYWIEGGNPRLKPERSLNFDAGLVGGWNSEDIEAGIELIYFSIDASDKIVWQPSAGVFWTPVNLQSVSSQGAELRVNVNLWKHLLMLQYSHNVLSTIKTSSDGPGDAAQGKFLPYVPQEFSSFTAGSSWNGLSVNISYLFSGFRYETSDNNPRFFLPTYRTIDANIAYGFSWSGFSLRVKGEINNAAEEEYELIRGYPVPLRNYTMTITITY